MKKIYVYIQVIYLNRYGVTILIITCHRSGVGLNPGASNFSATILRYLVKNMCVKSSSALSLIHKISNSQK